MFTYRPDPNALGWLGVGLVAGAALWPWLQPGPALLIGLLVVALAALGLGRRLLDAAMLFGLVLGALSAAALPTGPVIEGPVVLVGAVSGAPSGRRAQVSLQRARSPDGPWTPLQGRVQVIFPTPAPAAGTPVLVRGTAGSIQTLGALPGAPDPRVAARRAGIRTQVRARTAVVLGRVPERRALRARAHSGVLEALATGKRDGVDDTTWEVLRDTGTSHLLAISGFHVGLVAGLCALLVRLTLRPLALVRRVGWPERFPTAAAAVLGAASYTLAAGAPVSAQRALVGVTLAAIAHASGRRVEPWSVVGLAATAVVVLDPASVATPGFQLSFGAVLGLIRLLPLLTELAPEWLPAPLTWAWTSTAVTVAATVGTLPAAAWWFQSVAPGSPAANLVAIPLVAFGVVPAAMAAHHGPLFLAEPAAAVGDMLVAVLLCILETVRGPVWHPAVGSLGALVGALLLLCPWRWLPRLASVALLLGLHVRPTDALEVVALDVGQGDAALVRWPDGRTWLIDGGRPGERVLQWLRREGIDHLDVVVASHGQSDHVGGLPPVLEQLSVGELWISHAHGLHEVLAAAQASDTPVVAWPSQALHPHPPFASAEINDHSLVLMAEWAGRRALFTGDIERRAEAALPDIGPVDILRIPHHGSRTSSTTALFDKVQPALAITSTGRDNRYGHPASAVVDRYDARGIEVIGTAELRTIRVWLHADGRTQRWHEGSEPAWSLRPRRRPRRHDLRRPWP